MHSQEQVRKDPTFILVVHEKAEGVFLLPNTTSRGMMMSVRGIGNLMSSGTIFATYKYLLQLYKYMDPMLLPATCQP